MLILSLHAFPKHLLLATVRGRLLGQMDFWAGSVQPVVFYLSFKLISALCQQE